MLVTFGVIVVIGAVICGAVIWLSSRLGAPSWLTWLVWLAPTTGAVAWVVVRPTPAIATDDDDESWTGYVIRYVIVGEDTPRAAPVRLLAALVFGAPVVWSLAAFGLATLLGVF